MNEVIREYTDTWLTVQAERAATEIIDQLGAAYDYKHLHILVSYAYLRGQRSGVEWAKDMVRR